jgi:hypothetical protein
VLVVDAGAIKMLKMLVATIQQNVCFYVLLQDPLYINPLFESFFRILCRVAVTNYTKCYLDSGVIFLVRPILSN